MNKVILAIAFLLLSNVLCFAQKNWTLNAPKNTIVVLKIPRKAFSHTKLSNWTGKNTYSAQIEQDKDGSLTINSEKNWKDMDWNLMTDLYIENVERKKENKKQLTEVLLKNDAVNVRLVFDGSIQNVGKAFDDLTFRGNLNDYEKSDYYKTEVLGRFMPKIFVGKLGVLPESFKLKLLRIVNYEPMFFGGENFKDNFYFVLKMAPPAVIDSARFGQPQRVSMLFNQLLLGELKGLYSELKDVKEMEGIKFEALISHRNYYTGGGDGQDHLQVYAKMENIKLFSEFEITGQELLDRSVVIIDNNRANVNLTLQ